MALDLPRFDLKLVLLGDAFAGKTSLASRFIFSKYTPNSSTTSVAAFSIKRCQVGNMLVVLGVWDTAGQEKCDALTSFYTKNAFGAIICYDITDKNSLLNIDKWFKKVSDEADPDCSILLVGTKSDLEKAKRQVSADDGRKIAAKYGALFIETSALTGNQVREAFDILIRDCVRKFHAINNNQESIPLLPETSPVSNSCCPCF